MQLLEVNKTPRDDSFNVSRGEAIKCFIPQTQINSSVGIETLEGDEGADEFNPFIGFIGRLILNWVCI